MGLGHWLRRLLSGKPHYVIGEIYDPYMLRWWLVPRNKYFNIYLHKILKDDVDEALHDHPWNFISIILKGGYWEFMPGEKHLGTFKVKDRRPFRIAYRRGDQLHRVVLHKPSGKPTRSWSIIITGHIFREWGFQCPKGWVHWKEFVERRDGGNTRSRGCGEFTS